MIAMALAGRPDLLIADEPTTALDVTVQRQVLDLLQAIQRDTGMAMLMVSHDLGVVAQIADRVAVLYCGRVLETAPTAAILDRPFHPYAAGLVACVPPDPRRRQMFAPRPIRGAVASLGALPPGCHFHPRCDRATAICATSRPPVLPAGSGRLLACHNPVPAEGAA